VCQYYFSCSLIQYDFGAAWLQILRKFFTKKESAAGAALSLFALWAEDHQMARSTLLERRHLVQTYTWHGVPSTIALTRFTLGFQLRLALLWEWDTLMPKVTPLPQTSHFAICCTSLP